MNAAQAEELFALARQQGIMLQGYQNRRFDSDFLMLKAVIESGKLGDLLEVESCFDDYRPHVPEGVKSYSRDTSFVYGHAVHSLNQIISLFGAPKQVHYDVRSLLGADRMIDYFDIDFYYDAPLKVSIRSSYGRIKSRPKFSAWVMKGMFVKASGDRQEEDLKRSFVPKDFPDFGKDRTDDYGTLICSR